MKCGACGKAARTTRRALLLTGPGKTRPGRVCSACARTGWLLVFAAIDEAPRGSKRKRERDAMRSALHDSLSSLSKMKRAQREYAPGLGAELAAERKS